MKKLIVFTILSLFVCNFTLGQDREKYSDLIQTALNLYESKDYLKSGEKYSEAFIKLGGKGKVNDRYNAACSWALANQPDSAFVQLFKIAEKGNYTNYGHITTDSDLNSLHTDQRWGNVIGIIKANKEKAEANLEMPLVAILDTILQEDQKYRQQEIGIEEKFGWESDEMKAHWKIINEKDSINLIKIKKILDERGWLGADVIGDAGNLTLFLVIQHSDIETQEKYLPMMREAVKNGNANSNNLALLEDRVAIIKGGKQIYGSQIGRDQETGEYYILPLWDPENVDQRREEVGLGPLQEYVSKWGINWSVEDYKKSISGYEVKEEK
jgi:hypothetical protein